MLNLLSRTSSHFQFRKQRQVLLRESHLQDHDSINTVSQLLVHRRPRLLLRRACRPQPSLDIFYLVVVCPVLVEQFLLVYVVLRNPRISSFTNLLAGS